MFIIKTQNGKLVNMDCIEAVHLKGNRLTAFTPCYGDDGNYDEYPLYEDDSKEHLEKALDSLFAALTQHGVKGFDFSVEYNDERGE